MASEKPCLTCKMVKDPDNCENKSCQAWREWFMEKWRELHNGK